MRTIHPDELVAGLALPVEEVAFALHKVTILWEAGFFIEEVCPLMVEEP